MRRRFAGVPAVVALALALASCSASGEDDGADGVESGEESTSVDSALLECGEPDDGAVQLATADLQDATWTTPDGFVETFAYGEDRPVEHVATIWVAEPESDPQPLDVLIVVVYSDVDWGDAVDECGRVPAALTQERLAGYREEAGAEALTDPVAVEVGGLPALQQDVALPDYDYRGTWVFGRTQLLHLYCQWTSASSKEQIVTACQELVDSATVPGA